MRSMWNAARMQSDGTGFNPFARTEIATHIKKYFVRFDVIVHPGNLHGFRMIIEHPRCERTDDVAADFEGLMNRRRLMDRAGNRFEVLRVKRERINKAVPADNVEGVMGVNHARPARAVFHEHLYVLVLVDGQQLGWPVEIALGIGRAHSDLTLVV